MIVMVPRSKRVTLTGRRIYNALWKDLAALPVDMGDPEATRVYKLG